MLSGGGGGGGGGYIAMDTNQVVPLCSLQLVFYHRVWYWYCLLCLHSLVSMLCKIHMGQFMRFWYIITPFDAFEIYI